MAGAKRYLTFLTKTFSCMKKLYLLLVVAMAFVTTTNAQCPNPNGIAILFKVNGNECIAHVSNTLPDAHINVFSGLTKINVTEAKTVAAGPQSGSGSVMYDCSLPVTLIVLVNNDGVTCEIGAANITQAAPLPIKLTDFRAKLKNNSTASLQWISEFESGSNKFVVERSLDGVSYAAIGEVPAAVYSETRKSYSFDDVQLGERAAWYRLRLVDFDGKQDLSKTVYVNNKFATGSSPSFSVYPNPFKTELQLVGIKATEINRKSVRVYDASGREIAWTITGANAITIDNSAPRGVYILRVQEKTFKLIKE